MSQNVTVSGSGYYTDDAEYVVSQQPGTLCWIVTRGDGSCTVAGDGSDLDAAHNLARGLADGSIADADCEWQYVD